MRPGGRRQPTGHTERVRRLRATWGRSQRSENGPMSRQDDEVVAMDDLVRRSFGQVRGPPAGDGS